MTLAGASTRPSPPPPARSSADVRPLLRAIVARTLREPPSHPDVDDATQEAVRRFLDAGGGSTGLAVTIARNTAIDLLRARARQRARAGEVDDEWSVPDLSPLPDERLARREEVRRTASALERLPAAQREALLLLVTEDLSYEEIGRRLDAPVGTVASWILRARKSVARALAKDGWTP